MPAPDLATIFAVADAIHPRLKLRLTPILATYTPRETGDDLPSARIDCAFIQGAWAKHWGLDRAGELHHNVWEYRLSLEVATARPALEGQPPPPDSHWLDLHAKMRARIHAEILAAAKDPAFLPWHCLASCDEAGFDATVVTTDACDISKLVFTGLVSIRSDAWPLL